MVRRSFTREFKLEAVKLVKERGVSVTQAARDLELAEHADCIAPRLHVLIVRLRNELEQLEARIEEASREIREEAAADHTARRLMAIPGIGALGATAFLAAVGNARRFRSGPYMAAGLGWFRVSTPQEARTPCFGSASAATATCAGS